MKILFSCVNCGMRYKAGLAISGKSFNCKKCGIPLVVPSIESEEEDNKIFNEHILALQKQEEQIRLENEQLKLELKAARECEISLALQNNSPIIQNKDDISVDEEVAKPTTTVDQNPILGNLEDTAQSKTFMGKTPNTTKISQQTDTSLIWNTLVYILPLVLMICTAIIFGKYIYLISSGIVLSTLFKVGLAIFAMQILLLPIFFIVSKNRSSRMQYKTIAVSLIFIILIMSLAYFFTKHHNKLRIEFQTEYNSAIKDLEQKKYADAYIKFRKLSTKPNYWEDVTSLLKKSKSLFLESKYEEGLNELNSSHYIKAYSIFKSILGEDSHFRDVQSILDQKSGLRYLNEAESYLGTKDYLVSKSKVQVFIKKHPFSPYIESARQLLVRIEREEKVAQEEAQQKAIKAKKDAKITTQNESRFAKKGSQQSKNEYNEDGRNSMPGESLGKYLDYQYSITSSSGKTIAIFYPKRLPRNDGILFGAMFELISRKYGNHKILSMEPELVYRNGVGLIKFEGVDGNYMFLIHKEDTGEIHSITFWRE